MMARKSVCTPLLFLFGIAWLLLAGCSNSDEALPSVSPGTFHPTSDNIPDEDRLTDIIYMTGYDTATAREIADFAENLANAQEMMSIGTMEGDKYEMIGRVGDIATGEDGSIFLLDSRNNEVRVYSPGGAFERTFGGPGRGPDEFQNPKSLNLSRQGHLIVGDRPRTVKVFQLKDTSFVLINSMLLDYSPDSICLIGKQVYVRGFKESEEGQEGNVLHAYSMMGEHLHSFGEPYKSNNPLVQDALSRDGLVACDEETSTVVTMFKHLPVISGYSPDGALKWMSRIADFKSIAIEETINEEGKPAVIHSMPEVGENLALKMTAVPGGYMLVQIGRIPEDRDQTRPVEYLSYLISAETGEGIYVGNTLPLVYAVTPNQMYAGLHTPFPKVKVYEITPLLTGSNAP